MINSVNVKNNYNIINFANCKSQKHIVVYLLLFLLTLFIIVDSRVRILLTQCIIVFF
jgi:hypothetical protein